MSELVTYKELQEWYDVKNVNAVLSCLESDGIDYKLNKKGKPRTIRSEVVKAWYGGGSESWDDFE